MLSGTTKSKIPSPFKSPISPFSFLLGSVGSFSYVEISFKSYPPLPSLKTIRTGSLGLFGIPSSPLSNMIKSIKLSSFK